MENYEIQNYEVLEVIHTSRTSDSLVLKVKEKNKPICDKVFAIKLVGSLSNRLQKLIFKREIEALKILNSCDGIVKIRDYTLNVPFNNKNDWGMILLDYIEGENLESFNFNQLSQMKKYDICLKILMAIEGAHRNNVLHRDIKPSNIMYNIDTDKITIIDFGTSKIKSIVEQETTLPFYSPNFSAPEMIKGISTTEASDIYSLGAVIFYILFGILPKGTSMICNTMKDLETPEALQDLISKMVEEDPAQRFQNLSDVIDVFRHLMGDNLPNRNSYICSIDSEKLNYLKNSSRVESTMNMTIFTKSFLKDEFKDCSAYYNPRWKVYIFTGKSIALECTYNESTEIFIATRAVILSVDRKISNEKRGFRIDGILNFYDTFRNEIIGYNDNNKLLVQFNNNSSEKNLLLKQDELFDNLFGRWQDGLDEAIVNEKKRVGRIVYSSFDMSEEQLFLNIEEYKNRDIDELDNNIEYIIEDLNSRGNSFYYNIGTYNGIIYDENTTLIIDLDKRIQRGKVKSLLAKKALVMENFRANISAYKRQSYAIRALHDDNYSSKNLKDILLNLDEPTYTPYLSDIQYHNKELNESQKGAIKKALYSDSISLIQGPPGTGKTKVIKEFIIQLINKVNKFQEPVRILVVSQSNTAVDNIIEGLINLNEDNLDIIRIGREENISPLVEKYCTMPAIREKLFAEIQENSNEYIRQKDNLYENISDSQEINRWNRIKEIQRDWINRCSNLETLDYQLIKSATVIAGTCIGFLSNDFVKDLDFDYVIIDEAAKATTPELLVSIIKSKKIVLVGDQNQLPAYADQEISPIISNLTKDPKYRLFDLLFNVLPETHKQILTIQYRMKRNIGNLISQVFYGGNIATGVRDEKRLHPIKRFEGKSIIWINTSMMNNKDENKKKGGSFCNYAENTIIKTLLEKFDKEGVLPDLDIGIITGYRGQKELIRKSVNNCGYDKIAKNIVINTLDAFQGRENDIVIYSTVRTKRTIGFQKEKERVNVAFSRAKNLLIICGDMDFFYNFDDPENKYIEIIDYIRKHSDECEVISGDKL